MKHYFSSEKEKKSRYIHWNAHYRPHIHFMCMETFFYPRHFKGHRVRPTAGEIERAFDGLKSPKRQWYINVYTSFKIKRKKSMMEIDAPANHEPISENTSVKKSFFNARHKWLRPFFSLPLLCFTLLLKYISFYLCFFSHSLAPRVCITAICIYEYIDVKHRLHYIS